MAYNQGSIVHLECSGVMLLDMRNPIKLLKENKARKRLMEQMGAAYTAHGIITLAGSRMYTSMADTDAVLTKAGAHMSAKLSAKLLDFGLAKTTAREAAAVAAATVTHDTPLTQQGTLVGSPSTGTIRATARPFRSTMKDSRRYRIRARTSPKPRTSSVAVIVFFMITYYA